MDIYKNFLLFLFLSVAVSCKNESETKLPEPASSTSYSAYFRIKKTNNGTLLTLINPWNNNIRTTYVLQKNVSGNASGKKNHNILRIPLTNAVVLSANHIGMLSALGKTDIITGVDTRKNIYNPEVNRRILSGNIAETGEANRLSVEDVIALNPGLVIYSGMQQPPESVRQLEAAGIPVMATYGWMENHPLARAEWIKVFGALTGTEALADSIFRLTARSYLSLKKTVESVRDTPSVLVGQLWKGTWYAPAGNSYFGTIIADAGADYVWKNTPRTGSLNLDFEEIIARQSQAEIWMNAGIWQNTAELTAQDERLKKFLAVQKGNVYTYTHRQNTAGVNAFWEEGYVRPHLILSDWIKILHPGVLKDTNLYFYRKLKR